MPARPVLAFLSTTRGVAVSAAIVAFVIAMAQAPADYFVYDAMVYWSSTTSMLSGGDFFTIGGLVIRGAWSVLVYLPAALAAALIPSLAAPAVLAQNALLIAFLGAWLVPSAARLLGEVRPIQVWISAVVASVVLRELAPFPIMDLWAVSLVLGAIVLVARRREWWCIALGGLLLSVAVNLRPAYLVPVVLILAVWAISGRLRVLWAVAGCVLAVVPQIVLNVVFARSLLPWPVNLAAITTAQSEYASYIVRYDTANYVGNELPRLFYCSPGMAVKFSTDGPPESPIELVGAYLQTLPGSLQFVAQKVSSSLFWTSATPYSGPPTTETSALTLIVVVVSVVGFFALIAAALRLRTSQPRIVLTVVAAILALWLGAVGTLVFSTPEARFALPLVLIGLVGVVVGVGYLGRHQPPRRPILWGGITGAAVVAALLVGQAGLAHPAPIGDPTVEICSDPASFRN